VSNPIIKICGLRDPETAQVAIDAGATAIGFMLAESRRRVSLEEIADIRDRTDFGTVRTVGVVVNERGETLNEWRARARFDVLQLSGDEDVSILGHLDGSVWKAVRFEPGTAAADAARVLDAWFDHPRPVEVVLVDAFVKGVYGGSGHRADWELVGRLAERYPIVLAGGLSPENVSDAIGASTLRGVDVSSGVETDSTKDPEKINAFVTNALSAFEV
jgi:phosphoribosylanthranilate isomerase